MPRLRSAGRIEICSLDELKEDILAGRLEPGAEVEVDGEWLPVEEHPQLGSLIGSPTTRLGIWLDRRMPPIDDAGSWCDLGFQQRMGLVRRQLQLGRATSAADRERAAECIAFCPEERMDLLQLALDLLTETGNCSAVLEALDRRPELPPHFLEHPCRLRRAP